MACPPWGARPALPPPPAPWRRQGGLQEGHDGPRLLPRLARWPPSRTNTPTACSGWCVSGPCLFRYVRFLRNNNEALPDTSSLRCVHLSDQIPAFFPFRAHIGTKKPKSGQPRPMTCDPAGRSPGPSVPPRGGAQRASKKATMAPDCFQDGQEISQVGQDGHIRPLLRSNIASKKAPRGRKGPKEASPRSSRRPPG